MDLTFQNHYACQNTQANCKYLLDALHVLFNLIMQNSGATLMSPILGLYDWQFNVNVKGLLAETT